MISKKILVVDDERDIREMLIDLLTSRGHQVICAGDGIECGVQLFTEKPDIVLMDLNMPNMNGIKAVKYIKGGVSEIHRKLKIIVVSGFIDAVSIEILNKYKVPFLTKPIHFDELYKLIED